jgi:hypothetical protein
MANIEKRYVPADKWLLLLVKQMGHFYTNKSGYFTNNFLACRRPWLPLLVLFLAGFWQDVIAQSGVRSRSIRSAEEPITFHIFPNPNEGKFTVTVKDLERSFDINVYNLIGEMVYHWESNETTGDKIEINLSKHPKGVYLVELDTEKGNVIKKVVVDTEKGG